MWVAGRHRCSGERLATLLDMVRDHFVLAPDAEVSTEANPESTWPEFFATIRAAGYTRVSLGMQSVAPRVRWQPWTGCTRRAGRRPRPPRR